jgi:hypothetical protein
VAEVGNERVAPLGEQASQSVLLRVADVALTASGSAATRSSGAAGADERFVANAIVRPDTRWGRKRSPLKRPRQLDSRDRRDPSSRARRPRTR